jgi:hypothetical protein
MPTACAVTSDVTSGTGYRPQSALNASSVGAWTRSTFLEDATCFTSLTAEVGTSETTDSDTCRCGSCTLMMEALRSSETSVLTRATRRNIPDEAILHSHRRENLKSYIGLAGWTL